MSLIRIMERPKVLSVWLPSLSAVLFLASMRTPEPAPAAAPVSDVHVYDKGNPWSNLSAVSPLVTEVRRALAKELTAIKKGGGATDGLRTLLTRLYGSHVNEETYAMYYAWEWNGETWVLVCTGGSEFEIDFGVKGSVVVETNEQSRVF